MTGPVGLAFAMRYKYEGDALGYPTNGGDGNNAAGNIGGNTALSDGKELGYNYLNTAFTGASSAELSGNDEWDNIAEDAGVGALISQFELSSKIPQITVSFEKTAVEALTRRLAANGLLSSSRILKI
jgi:hypothetical protein